MSFQLRSKKKEPSSAYDLYNEADRQTERDAKKIARGD